MKKIIGLIMILAVLAGGAFFGYQYLNKNQINIESVLQEDPVFYFKFTDVEKNINDMARSQFWLEIGKIKWDLVMKESGLPDDQRMIVDKALAELRNLSKNPLIKNLLSEEVALAVYPHETLFQDVSKLSNEEMMKAIESFFAKFLIVSRLKPEVKAAEILTRSIEQYGANVSVEKEEYKKSTINLLKIKNTPMVFAYVRLKDLLVIGLGTEGVKASVDAYSRESASLADSTGFTKDAGRFLKDADIEGYWKITSVIKFFEDQMRIRARINQQERIEQYFQALKTFKTLVFSADFAKVNDLKAEIVLDKSKLPADIAPMYNCSSSENKTAEFIPKDVLGYQWNKCFDPQYYWKEMKKELNQSPDGQKESAQNQIASIENFLGLSIENDLLPAFGDEVGGYLTDLDLTAQFPLPKLAVFIKIKDKKRIQPVLDLLKTIPMVALQQEEHASVPYQYVALPFGEAIQPGYFYLEDYLIFSINRQLIKDSIDAFKNSETSFKGNKFFAQYPEFKEKNMSVFFMRTDKITRKVRGVIEWGMKSSQAKAVDNEAFRSGAERRLTELNEKYKLKEAEVKSVEERIKKADDEIWLLESKNEDAAPKRNQLGEMKKEKELIEGDLKKLTGQRKELEDLIDGYASGMDNPRQQQFYLEEVVFPVLDALETNEWVLSTGETTPDSFVMMFNIKVK